jgi:hypothetical protein
MIAVPYLAAGSALSLAFLVVGRGRDADRSPIRVEVHEMSPLVFLCAEPLPRVGAVESEASPEVSLFRPSDRRTICR